MGVVIRILTLFLDVLEEGVICISAVEHASALVKKLLLLALFCHQVFDGVLYLIVLSGLFRFLLAVDHFT